MAIFNLRYLKHQHSQNTIVFRKAGAAPCALRPNHPAMRQTADS